MPDFDGFAFSESPFEFPGDGGDGGGQDVPGLLRADSHRRNGNWQLVRQNRQNKEGGFDFCSPIDPCADTTYAVGKYVLQCLGICSAVTPHRTVSTEQGKGLDVAVKEFADVLEA